MRIAGKEIKDECQYCGSVLTCETAKQGHGIGQERTNVTKMIRCQLQHAEKRESIDSGM